MKYKLKSYTVDAIQWNGINLEEIKHFMKEKFIEACINEETFEMTIKTIDEDKEIVEFKVMLSDYITKECNNNFYAFTKQDFENTFEPVEE